MFKLLLFIALAVSTISKKVIPVSDEPYPYAIHDNIINLGEPTWDTAFKEFSTGFIIYYYEAYCLPCRQFWPEFKTVAAAIAQELPEGANPPIAKIECHDEVRLCERQEVTNFPTILLYREGKPAHEYTGPRTADAFEKWAKMVLFGEYQKVKSKEELFKRYTTAIVLNNEASYVDEAYVYLTDMVEIVMADGDLKDQVKGDGGIMTQEGLKEELPGSAEGIVARVNDILYGSRNAVPNFAKKESVEIQGPANKNYVLFFRTNKFSYASKEARAFDKVAQNPDSGDFSFVYVNVEGDILGATMAKHFGVKNGDAVTVGIASKNGKIIKKYRLDQNQAVTEDSVNELLKDFPKKDEEKKYKRYMMSAPVPPKAKRGNVVELVTSNFKETVNNPDLNVFVMFYFPWCEWCVKLEAIWKSLAYKYRDEENHIIARIDVSQNDIEYELTEFPVLFFYEARANKEPIEYLSDKTMPNIKEFLEKQATIKTEIDL